MIKFLNVASFITTCVKACIDALKPMVSGWREMKKANEKDSLWDDNEGKGGSK